MIEDMGVPIQVDTRLVGSGETWRINFGPDIV